MEWTPESQIDPNRLRKLELTLENCMMLSRRKRAMRCTFPDGKIDNRVAAGIRSVTKAAVGPVE